MDRTILYRELVRLANPNEIQSAPNHSPSTVDPLIKEAERIQQSISRLDAYLARVRKSYLIVNDSKSLSEDECNEVDRSVQSVLRKALAQIKQLEALEQSRVERQAKKPEQNKLLKGVEDTRHLHRRGVLVNLNEQLKAASDKHVEQQNIRLSRKATQIDLFVTPPAQPPLKDSWQHDNTKPSFQTTQFDLTPEQQQVLVQENDALLLELNETLQKAQSAERSLQEISALQSELSAHLQTQTEQANQLVDMADRASSDIGLANTQIQKASVRNRRASQFVIYSSFIIALLLLACDYAL